MSLQGFLGGCILLRGKCYCWGKAFRGVLGVFRDVFAVALRDVFADDTGWGMSCRVCDFGMNPRISALGCFCELSFGMSACLSWVIRDGFGDVSFKGASWRGSLWGCFSRCLGIFLEGG